MTPIKRKKRVSYQDFCSIFTKRKFTKREKITRSIYMIEDVDGNYRIEEHPTLIGL